MWSTRLMYDLALQLFWLDSLGFRPVMGHDCAYRPRPHLALLPPYLHGSLPSSLHNPLYLGALYILFLAHVLRCAAIMK